MKHLLSILLAAALCATTSAQTIRTLGYNTTNGQVVANTGTNVLTFTNELNVSSQRINIGQGLGFWDTPAGEYALFFQDDDPVILSEGRWNDPSVRASLGFSTNLNTLWTATNGSNARSAVNLGATWLTNTNVTNFRSAIGLGATNDVTFQAVDTYMLKFEGVDVFEPETRIFFGAISFDNETSTATTRTNLGLGLPALTNTSNVTTMRALAGSTNTNQPFSGSISVVGTNNTNTLVFSNGILLSQ